MDAAESRARQKLLQSVGRGTRPVADAPQPRDMPAASQSWIRGVLRSIDVVAASMTWQRIRYTDSPPVVGQVEAFGRVETCYPLETARVADYGVWVWPATVTSAEGTVDNPITLETIPVLFSRNGRGDWIAMVAWKFDASLLDPTEPANECSF